jgi:hypothetical protein
MALLAASAAVYYRVLHTQGPNAQASEGMYGFGDAMLFGSVFGLFALFPTCLALYFLRPFKRFWTVFSITSLGLACTGLVAASVIVLASTQPHHQSAWAISAAFGVLRMLVAPLLAPAFIIAAIIAPTRLSRWALVGAAAIEGMIGTYAFFHWFAGLRLF